MAISMVMFVTEMFVVCFFLNEMLYRLVSRLTIQVYLVNINKLANKQKKHPHCFRFVLCTLFLGMLCFDRYIIKHNRHRSIFSLFLNDCKKRNIIDEA